MTGELLAINPATETADWTYSLGSDVSSEYSSPAIAPDGTIYIGSADGFVVAISTSGSVVWKSPPMGAVESSPAIGSDGTIYVLSNDGNLYALSPVNGSVNWAYQTNDTGTPNTLAIASDGTVLVSGHELEAVYPNGTFRWSASVASSVAAGPDGTIYAVTIGSVSDSLAAYNLADGTLKWQFPIGYCDNATFAPSIDADGTVYINTAAGLLWAIR